MTHLIPGKLYRTTKGQVICVTGINIDKDEFYYFLVKKPDKQYYMGYYRLNSYELAPIKEWKDDDR